LLPGLDPSRSILILAGNSTFGTEAAVEYVCREDSIKELLRRLNVSKPADLNMPATAAASFAGFWSRATFLYAELPMTSATRLSAKALTPVVARMAAANTIERNEIIAKLPHVTGYAA